MLATRAEVAIKILQATTDAMRRLQPDLGLSFGYIGNLDGRFDDRLWSEFSKLSTRADATACNVSWGSAATASLGDLAVRAAFGEVLDWADRQAIALRSGRLHQMCPRSRLDSERAYAAAWKSRVLVG